MSLAIREAYLTMEQMDSIRISLSTASDTDMGIQGQRRDAQAAANRLCEQPWFFLYEKTDMSKPVACCFNFTGEGLIIPTGSNELKQKIYVEWSGRDFNRKYRSASDRQTACLKSYLNQMRQSNQDAEESAFRFLDSVDCLLFQEDSLLKQYKITSRPPNGGIGYSLPVWSYPLRGGEEFLNGLVRLYQNYDLVPKETKILAWLQDFFEMKMMLLTEDQYSKLKKYYCEADQLRLGSKDYLLSDTAFDGGQCWEIYENGVPDTDKIRCIFPGGKWLGAKETVEYIANEWVVSIDFGTKSSVIVISNPNRKSFLTLKFKAGAAKETSLYPTVLKFCGLDSFLDAYAAKAGRPDTSWETVSIDDAVYEGQSDVSLGIFRGLKQWMMDPKAGGTVLRQKDAPDRPVILNEYGSRTNSVDPIELYAYYLGLYMNNNQDNRIFMKYRLSFPATCPKEIQSRMEESFRRGLVKSLPVSIMKSPAMEQFAVACTCPEPAAYAVCALAFMDVPRQYQAGFLCGIFDFGGGSCDFNYGIWSAERNETLRRIKYKIRMLGDGGDPFLGGENLLELLAVQVYIMERKFFEQQGYKISRPRCYEGSDETFFSDSFEAANNLCCLVEQLRNPVWEKPNEVKPEKIRINFAGLLPEKGVGGKEGTVEAGPELDYEKLEVYLAQRIEEGVSAFFNTFYRILEEQRFGEISHFCVFLAGNSCRSKLVRMMFEKYIEERHLEKVYICDPIGGDEFEKNFPSGLWDEEQKKKMYARISGMQDLNGKTGVAYGLALYGNQVEIEDCRVKDYLQYYLGISSFFEIDLLEGAHSKRLAIGESVPFADSAICNLYYTQMVPIDGVLRGTEAIVLNEKNVPMEKNMICYVRADSQTEISVFAAPGDSPEEHDPNDELSIDLQSGKIRKAAHSDMGR